MNSKNSVARRGSGFKSGIVQAGQVDAAGPDWGMAVGGGVVVVVIAVAEAGSEGCGESEKEDGELLGGVVGDAQADAVHPVEDAVGVGRELERDRRRRGDRDGVGGVVALQEVEEFGPGKFAEAWDGEGDGWLVGVEEVVGGDDEFLVGRVVVGNADSEEGDVLDAGFGVVIEAGGAQGEDGGEGAGGCGR